LVITMLIVGSGWTWSNWSVWDGMGGQYGSWGGVQQVSDPTANVNQQNTAGPERENIVSITYTNSPPPTFTWDCYNPPSTCWNCDDPDPYPGHQPQPSGSYGGYRWFNYR